MRAVFKGHIKERVIRNVLSILVGSHYIESIGDFGHYTPHNKARQLLLPLVGYEQIYSETRTSISDLLEGQGGDLTILFEKVMSYE
jgi:hypothetical protein